MVRLRSHSPERSQRHPTASRTTSASDSNRKTAHTVKLKTKAAANAVGAPTTQVASDSMTRTKWLSPPALSTGPARIMLATFTHRTREDEQAQPPHVPDVTCCRKQPVVHRRTGSQQHANPHRSHDTSNDQLLPTQASVAEIVAAKALPEEHPGAVSHARQEADGQRLHRERHRHGRQRVRTHPSVRHHVGGLAQHPQQLDKRQRQHHHGKRRSRCASGASPGLST